MTPSVPGTTTRVYPLTCAPARPLRYVVVLARLGGDGRGGDWLLVRHRARATWECPGGHIEPGETPLDAARRELHEETGAVGAQLSPAGFYAVGESWGQVFRAGVARLGPRPPSEIAEVRAFAELPLNLTYPEIMPPIFAAFGGDPSA